MLATSHALAFLAILAVGVIYGTDLFSALVLRPAMAALTDPELTQAAGRIHEYGDQRLPLPGAAGTVAAAAAAISAGFAGHPVAAALAGAARRVARVARAIPANRRPHQPPHDQPHATMKPPPTSAPRRNAGAQSQRARRCRAARWH